MSAGLAAPEHLVDVNRLPGLDTLEVVDGELRIGALVRHSTLAALAAGHPVAATAPLGAGHPVAAAAPLLPAAAPWISHEAVRNRGTMLGSLVHADPSAEWPAVALATGARLRLVRKGGERWVPAAELYLGPLTADVEPEELAVELRLPVAPARTAAAVRELAYRDGDYAVVGVAAQVTLDDRGGIADARIGLFGVDATPVRPAEAESLLVQGGPGALEDAAAAAGAEVNPGSDATASAEYRREMVPVFVRRAVAEAIGRASALAAGSPGTGAGR
jgi:carbon-monoxide dehydrogenase medium subunit